MSEIVLEDCPFCKGKLLKFYTEISGHAEYKRRISCDDCGATVSGNDNYDVINKWNTRVLTKSIGNVSSESFNYQQVKEWALNPNRKPAVLSFTSGVERDVAYLIEDLQQKTGAGRI
jgi:hypothetical protein